MDAEFGKPLRLDERGMCKVMTIDGGLLIKCFDDG